MDINDQPSESLDDRRIFERFSARLPAKIKDSRSTYGADLYLRDLSAMGAQFMSKASYYLNDSITVDVEMPGTFPLTIKGAVVWVMRQGENRWDFGVQFHKPNLIKFSRLYERLATSSPEAE